MASSQAADELLIQLVRDRKCLYDASRKEYRDNGRRENAWKFIGTQLGCTSDEAQKRWRVLRDKFNREKKALEAKMKSGAPAGISLKWPLYHHMTFLSDHMRSRSQYGNFHKFSYIAEEDPSQVNDSSDTQPETMVETILETEETPRQASCSPFSPVASRPSLATLPSSSDQHSASSQIMNGPASKKRVRSSEERRVDDFEVVSALKSITSAITTHKQDAVNHEVSSFCESIGARLRNLPPRSRSLAYIELAKTLYDIEYPD